MLSRVLLRVWTRPMYKGICTWVVIGHVIMLIYAWWLYIFWESNYSSSAETVSTSQLFKCFIPFTLSCFFTYLLCAVLYMILVINNVCIIFCVPLSLFFHIRYLATSFPPCTSPAAVEYWFQKYVHRSAVLGRLFISLSSGTNHLKHCLSTWALVVPRERLCNQ